jgi:hypothetical protein
MDSALEARYPQLRTYGGKGTDDATANARFDFNPNGFHAYITDRSGEWFMEPLSRQIVICFNKQDAFSPGKSPFELPGSPTK